MREANVYKAKNTDPSHLAAVSGLSFVRRHEGRISMGSCCARRASIEEQDKPSPLSGRAAPAWGVSIAAARLRIAANEGKRSYSDEFQKHVSD